MDTWFIIVLSLCVSALFSALLLPLYPSFNYNNKKKLPPGPPTIPVIGNLLWLSKSMSELEPILRDLRVKYGPIITLMIGSRAAIFVGSHSLAHRALVQNGALFSDRPSGMPTSKVLNSNQHNISSAAYGPTWRLLRRNLTSEILHPTRVKSYSLARRWVLGILRRRLLLLHPGSGPVTVVNHFQYAMFCLLALMCFGDELQEEQIKEIERVQRRLLLSFGTGRFNVLNFWPKLGTIVFRNRWKELIQLRQDQEDVLIPLIEARITKKQQQQKQTDKDAEECCCAVLSYVDTLVNLELPEEGKRKLTEGEMVSLCGEFLNAGTDTTSTALQWIMANLVKYPHIQSKLYEEISGVVGPPPPRPVSSSSGIVMEEELKEEGGTKGKGRQSVEEEDLQKMPYLRAVVLESLRLHPPGHFVLPHKVTEEVELDGYVVPKDVTVNFMVAEMGRDPEVWDDPMDFKPDRFMTTNSTTAPDDDDHKIDSSSNVELLGGKVGGGGGGAGVAMFDITGSREIKMMPFGAGRRICPGLALALLHLEFFVANLIWYFNWSATDGDDVDLSEKQEFTIVMKNPLRANIFPRL